MPDPDLFAEAMTESVRRRFEQARALVADLQARLPALERELEAIAKDLGLPSTADGEPEG